jgi:uncharacterized membrane protein
LKDMDLGEEKHLREFLRGLRTKGGKEFLVSDLKNEFYKYVKDITEELYKSVNKKKYFYGNPDKMRKKYYGFGFFALFAGIQATIFAFTGSIYWAAGIAAGVGISGLITLCFAPAMPKRTYKGRKVLTDILGFKEFLVKVEKGRLKRMLEENPTIFFDFLSYAIALGVVDEWAERFRGLQIEPPNWYRAHGLHGPIMTSHITRSIGNSIGAFTSAASTPRGSSSGFSGGGGGFSGGGGGGGGGGGW